jgi:hypothetical protein
MRHAGSSYPAFLIAIVGAFAQPAAARAEAWSALETDHFQVLSQVPESRSRDIIRRLHVYMQALPKLTNLPVRPASVPTLVFLLDEASFERTRAGQSRATGYFLPRTFRNIIVVNASRDLATSLQIIQHEYVHFAIQNARLSNLPAFYEEGLAQFMESFTYRGQRFNWGYYPPGYQAIARSHVMSLPRLLAVKVGEGDYVDDDRRTPFYLRSLLLMHYCSIGEAGLREPYQRLAARIADGDPPDEAFDAEFGMSPGALDEELDMYLVRDAELRYMSLPAGELERDPGIRKVSLSAGEADVRFGNLLLETSPRDGGLATLFLPHLGNAAVGDHATAGLAIAYELHGRRKESDVELDRLATMPDVSVAALLRAGELLFTRAQEDIDPDQLRNVLRRAASFYDAALGKDPDSIEALFGRGVVEIYLQDDLEGSLRRLLAAYPKSDQNADLALLLALHFDLLGEEEAARKIMESAACGAVSPRMRALVEDKLGAFRCYSSS